MRSLLLAIVALIAPNVASADLVVDQLNGFGVTTTFGGLTSARSQYDTTPILGPGLAREMDTVYDDFTLNANSNVDQIQWSGKYRGAGLQATDFRISFYQDNGGAIGAQVGTTIIAPLASVSQTAYGTDHFSYSYTPTGLTLNGGQKYWMSVVAALDFGNNGGPSATENSWGWAFTNKLGTQNTLQGYQVSQVDDGNGNLVFQTFNDPINYSFNLNVTAVPEPSTCLLLAGAVSGIAVRKWRARRKANA